VQGDRAAAERLRRDQLEPSRAGQPALVQGRAVAGDPGVNEDIMNSRIGVARTTVKSGEPGVFACSMIGCRATCTGELGDAQKRDSWPLSSRSIPHSSRNSVAKAATSWGASPEMVATAL
jgi:hypothetical protein